METDRKQLFHRLERTRSSPRRLFQCSCLVALPLALPSWKIPLTNTQLMYATTPQQHRHIPLKEPSVSQLLHNSIRNIVSCTADDKSDFYPATFTHKLEVLCSHSNETYLISVDSVYRLRWLIRHTVMQNVLIASSKHANSCKTEK